MGGESGREERGRREGQKDGGRRREEGGREGGRKKEGRRREEGEKKEASIIIFPFIPPTSYPSSLPSQHTLCVCVCVCVHGYIHASAFEQDLSQSSICKSRTWSARQPDVTTE